MPLARLRRSAWLSLMLACMAASAAQAAPPPSLPDIRHYEVRLEPDLAQKRLSGSETLTLGATPPGATALVLDAGDLQIDAVRENGRALAFKKSGGRLTLQLPAPPPKPGAERRVRIDFHGAPTKGLNFLPEAGQVYTEFSTSQWMPCVDAPAHRATLALSLLLPVGWQAVANGQPVRVEPQPGGRVLHRWSLALPMPSYLYGFAAGRLREVIDDSAAPTLRFLAPDSFSEAQLRRIFQDTRATLAFYAERAGMPYPLPVYSQVLVSGPAAQEMAGFAVMGQGFGQRALQDPDKTWLAAHELSHQWWGNAVTNQDWTEFWLNEGLASFMNAAWFEQRDGRARYDALIVAARTKYEAVRAAGHDKPLVFPDWDHPTADDRSLVYDKGALVVHELRLLMGEAAFWRGLKAYTQAHWGHSVRSADFRQAMQAETSQDLGGFFARWVDGVTPR